MIYLFTGNSAYLVKEKTRAWKDIFIKKYGDFNLVHIKDVRNTDNNILLENMTAGSFLGEKKLIIIDDLPLAGTEKKADIKAKQDFVMSLIEKVPNDNIVLFNSINPDKRSKFYKTLKKIAKLEEFNSDKDSEVSVIIKNKYGNKLDYKAIDMIIRYKGGNLTKIISEIDKLLITRDKITGHDIIDNIMPELEESIFQLIDDLLNLDIKNFLKKMNIILEQTSVYGFYNNLLANLRTSYYISKLKSQKVPDIATVLGLGNRGFLVNKNYKISFNKLSGIYLGLVELDKKMKSGKMIGHEESDFKLEIEKVVFKNII